ncbi:hypothetical protein TNIN_281211 [Trichonephila inaurata madagascariensis]|uniref:Uncharacterized protein n=1 Tax=Trichonephila inaurata madagascariensis TaxID=2747483 RepID=A0A8X6YQU1_9ARAC|nr:hypothetical protein TNIN_281211 [Trichonephila inaurata madagascariensis]
MPVELDPRPRYGKQNLNRTTTRVEMSSQLSQPFYRLTQTIRARVGGGGEESEGGEPSPVRRPTTELPLKYYDNDRTRRDRKSDNTALSADNAAFKPGQAHVKQISIALDMEKVIGFIRSEALFSRDMVAGISLQTGTAMI